MFWFGLKRSFFFSNNLLNIVSSIPLQHVLYFFNERVSLTIFIFIGQGERGHINGNHASVKYNSMFIVRDNCVNIVNMTITYILIF